MLSNSLPGLDFGLGSDIEMLRDTVRDFAQDKIARSKVGVNFCDRGARV